MTRKAKKVADDQYFKIVKRVLRDIFNEKKIDVNRLCDYIKDSKNAFDSNFTLSENTLFMNELSAYSEAALDNKMFFLFQCDKQIRPREAVDLQFLRVRKQHTFYLAYIGFNQNWYNVEENCEIFIEEVIPLLRGMQVAKDGIMNYKFYAWKDCSRCI